MRRTSNLGSKCALLLFNFQPKRNCFQNLVGGRMKFQIWEGEYSTLINKTSAYLETKTLNVPLRTGDTKKMVNFSLKHFFLGNWICLTNCNHYFNEGLQALVLFLLLLLLHRVFELFQVDFYHLIALLGASSHFHIILECWEESVGTVSCSRGFHAQEQKRKATRVWAQQFGFFNYSSGVTDGSWLWVLLLWER